MVEVTIKNFGIAVRTDAVATYSTKTATIMSLTRTEDANAGVDYTVIRLNLGSAVTAGQYRLAISPSSQSSTKVYIPLVFESSITATGIKFASWTAGNVEVKFNLPIGFIGQGEDQKSITDLTNFPCTRVVADAVGKFGTDLCTLNTAKTAIIATLEHNRGVTVVTGDTISLISGSIQPFSKLSSVTSQTLSIQNPSTVVAPIGRITAPQGIDLCTSSVTLKATLSVGAGYLTYGWSSTTNPVMDTFLKAQQSDASVVVLSTSASNAADTNMPSPGTTDIICLTVRVASA